MRPEFKYKLVPGGFKPKPKPMTGREFEQHIAANVTAYWLDRGFKVDAQVEKQKGGYSRDNTFNVRSDMVGGKPRGAAP